jgi:hypothetical protein
LAPEIVWVPRIHWYWRLVPVAATVSVTLVPAACVVVATGWAVIVGATTAPPELELLEEEELLEEDELEDEEELLEELVVPELVPLELLPPDEELLELEEELDEELELEEEELELLLVCVLTDIAGHLAEKFPAESIAATE